MNQGIHFMDGTPTCSLQPPTALAVFRGSLAQSFREPSQRDWETPVGVLGESPRNGTHIRALVRIREPS
jgi:hypothetical protein